MCQFFIHWSRTNLSRFFALVSLLGQVLNDIKSIYNTSTLLTHLQDPQFRFVRVLDTAVVIEGCYIHYDYEYQFWIQSGLNVGSDTIQRTMDAMERLDVPNSKAKTSSNRFGLFCPCKGIRSNSSARRG